MICFSSSIFSSSNIFTYNWVTFFSFCQPYYYTLKPCYCQQKPIFFHINFTQKQNSPYYKGTGCSAFKKNEKRKEHNYGNCCDYIIAPFFCKIQCLMYRKIPTNNLCKQFCGIIFVDAPQLLGITTEIPVRCYNCTSHSLLRCGFDFAA